MASSAHRRGIPGALAAMLLLAVVLGVNTVDARRDKRGLKPAPFIPIMAPRVCNCQNASQPLDVQNTRWALYKAQQRSPRLNFYVDWSELGGDSTADAAPVGESLGACSGNASKPIKSAPKQQDLVTCLNDKHLPRGITWATAMQDDTTTLKVVGTWWTEYSADVTTTLVTTATTDRLAQLEAQCRTWPGPLSVALFQGLFQEDATAPLTKENQAILRQAVVQISMFVADMATTPGYCQPDVMLTYEVYAEEAAKLLFPVNMLRNYARLQARTPLVALVDVDLVVSKSILQRIYNPKKASSLLNQALDKTVFIIPAFDVVGEFEVPAWADALVSSSKETMVHAYERDWVMPFHSGRFPVGHRLTNFTRWRVARNDYTVPYESMCEPWLIGHRILMPFHDARFRGFGLNKIQHIANLNADEFQFKVLHDVFIIHRPHKHAAAKSIYYQRAVSMPGLPSLRAHNYALLQDQQSLMASGTFQPVVSPAVSHCRNVLPWWTEAVPEPIVVLSEADVQAVGALQPVDDAGQDADGAQQGEMGDPIAAAPSIVMPADGQEATRLY